MELSILTILIILGLLSYFILLQIFILVFNKYQNEKLHKISEANFVDNMQHFHITSSRIENLLFQNYKSLHQSIVFDNILKDKIFTPKLLATLEKEYSKKIQSPFQITRIKASVMLGILGTQNARIILEKRLLKEKSQHIQIYIANSITEMRNSESIPLLVGLFTNQSPSFRGRLTTLICEYGIKFHEYFVQNTDQFRSLETIDLVLDFSYSYYSDELKTFLFSIANISSANFKTLDPLELKYLKEKALFVLSEYYYEEVITTDYLNPTDIFVKKAYANALANKGDEVAIDTLISYMFDESTRIFGINGILKIIDRKPVHLNKIISEFFNYSNISIRKYLTNILSQKLDYIVLKSDDSGLSSFDEIILECIITGSLINVISFINNNKEVEIENRVLKIINESLQEKEDLYPILYKNLNAKSLSKVKAPSNFIPSEKDVTKPEKSLLKATFFMLFLPFFIVPAVYFLQKYSFIMNASISAILVDFVISFNYYLAFYSIAVNFSYLFLLILSVFASNRQAKLWQIKKLNFLFKKRFLPTVSIIAPAYNESKSIIENTNSLLSLKYPDFELILVNDGSTDETMKRLTEYYGLQISNYAVELQLNSMPIRGIYTSKSFPKLIVVDKENGGKADSLNAGINVSRKEYFCGIDADSLLETDSLIKLSSIAIDQDFELPAIGGNIFPVNGCSVSHGHITSISIPKNNLAKLQMIEYIRSFMAGRLGWASINSLLIISGAFGLFRKERIINIGGYLTKSGIYHKDTVGEDMELVVRISRKLRELKQKFKIAYAFNANCWTEVPEDLKSLYIQRTRWHRGLIEILYFHKKLLFNPNYGRMGLFAFPYFLIFEIIGPVFEFQGYIMVLLAVYFGLMNFQLAILLFIGSILLGILISITALNIAQKNFTQFTYKDTFKLIFVSIVENFGPRQLLSFWRISGAMKILQGETGWGILKRKGFSTHN